MAWNLRQDGAVPYATSAESGKAIRGFGRANTAVANANITQAGVEISTLSVNGVSG